MSSSDRTLQQPSASGYLLIAAEVDRRPFFFPSSRRKRRLIRRARELTRDLEREPAVIRLTHIYDFGTSSETLIKVVDWRSGPGLTKRPIALMARNAPPAITCMECDREATHLGAGPLPDPCRPRLPTPPPPASIRSAAPPPPRPRRS